MLLHCINSFPFFSCSVCYTLNNFWQTKQIFCAEECLQGLMQNIGGWIKLRLNTVLPLKIPYGKCSAFEIPILFSET